MFPAHIHKAFIKTQKCTTPQCRVAAYHAVVKGEHAHISAVVDVVPSDDRVAVVFHPDAGQSVVRDLVVFVNSLNGKKWFHFLT